ncbi:gas vesicle protein [Streptomyces sp. NPDC049954]|uniref:gas vesicle protein n=1 Tax=Streptomyces sp. NPDC049954 TaxID=3155779 RepID=UPI00341EC1D8
MRGGRERDFVLPEPGTTNLADILERVLDKGIVIAGDIKIDLLDIELLTIRLRLFVSSVDTARKAGIDWWETDPALSSRARKEELAEENRLLRERVEALESALPDESASGARGCGVPEAPSGRRSGDGGPDRPADPAPAHAGPAGSPTSTRRGRTV